MKPYCSSPASCLPVLAGSHTLLSLIEMYTMATMLDRLRKRRCYPVALGNDEKVYCRSLTLGELQALEHLPPDLTTPFAIGCALVDDVGQQEIPRMIVADESTGAPAETNEAFARRALAALTDVPSDSIRLISEAINKINTAPPVEDLVKN